MAGNRLKQNLQSVIAELMGRLAASVQVSETILKQLGVNAIEVVDSSSITLLPGAKNAFPGTRTKASIKWHASFDILTGLLVWFQLTPGKRHDSKCFPEITSLKGKLVIFDLGYWDYAVLHAIEKAEGFFLSRVKSNAVIKIKKVIQGLSKEAIGQSLLSLDLSRKKGNIIEVIIEKIHQGSTLSYRVGCSISPLNATNRSCSFADGLQGPAAACEHRRAEGFIQPLLDIEAPHRFHRLADERGR
jgi:hypothetical protein